MALVRDRQSLPRETPLIVFSTSYDTLDWTIRVNWESLEDKKEFWSEMKNYCWKGLPPADQGALLYALGDHYSYGKAELLRKAGREPPTVEEAIKLEEAFGQFSRDLYRTPRIPKPAPAPVPSFWSWIGLK